MTTTLYRHLRNMSAPICLTLFFLIWLVTETISCGINSTGQPDSPESEAFLICASTALVAGQRDCEECALSFAGDCSLGIHLVQLFSPSFLSPLML